MVTFTIVSEYSQDPPTQLGLRQKIALGRPLYALDRVKEITKDGTGLLLWTRGCVSNVRDGLGWDNTDVIELIQQLRHEDYIDSEWCDNGKGALAACDAYSIECVEWIATANKNMRIEYFLKFAINKLGKMVLTISCHTSS
jgi:hypothetical protein